MNGYDAGTATGRLDLDVSGLNKGVSDAKQSLDSLDQTANQATADVDKYAQALNQNLAKAYEAVVTAMQQQEQAIQRVKELQEELAQVQERAARKQEESQKYSGIVQTQAITAYQKAIEDISKIEKDLAVAQQEEAKATEKATVAREQYANVSTKALADVSKQAQAVVDSSKQAEKSAENLAKAQINANAKVEAARVRSEAQQLAALTRQETDELRIIQQGELRKEQIRQQSDDRRYKADQDAIERMISKEEEGVRRSADRRYKAEQDAAAKIEKAKIDAEQKAAQAADKLAQDSADKRYKTDVDAATKLTIAREKLAQQAAQKEAEARQRELDKANRQAEKDAEDSAKKISDSQVAAYSVINRAVNDTINAVKQLTQEMINLGKEILEVGANFEQSMAQVAATSGMSANDISNSISEYNDLVEAARAAGESSIFTAAQAGEALNYLALAGYTVEESIKTMPDILTIATAGAMDLGRASDMVTDSMNALGISVDDTGEFIDKLARTAQTSNTNVEQLGRAILTVGGTATVLKGGITELDTALGLMANSGIKAQQGGTSLRQILLNLTDPSEKAKKKIEELGLEVFDADGGMRSLKDIFSDLNDIMADFSDQERMNALGEIFNARHIRAAVALMQQSGDAWDELQAKIEDADGAAEKMADTMKSTLKGSVALAQSSLESVTLTINEGLRKSITELVKDSIPKIDALNKTLSDPEVQEKLKQFSEELKEIGLVLLDKIIAFIPKIIDFLSHLKANLESLAVILTTIGTIKLIAALPDIATKLMALVAAINPLTVALVAVGAFLVGFIQTQERVNFEIQAHIEAVKEQNDVYGEQRAVVQGLVDDWEAYQERANEIVTNTEDQKTKVVALYEAYKKLHDANEDSTLAMEALADEVPDVKKMLAEGKASFEDITKAVDDYTDALIRSAQLEANKNLYVAAVEDHAKAKKALEEIEDAANKSARAVKDYEDEFADLEYKSLTGSISKDEQKKYEEYIQRNLNGELTALKEIDKANQEALADAKNVYWHTGQAMREAEAGYTEAMRVEAHNREDIVDNEIEGRRQAGEAYAKTVGEASKKAAKATLDDFWTEYNNLSRDVDLGYKSESEKWDLVRLYFTEHPDWAMLDEEFVKLIKQLRSYDDKIAEEEKNEAERRAKEQQDAADKAKKAREDADKKWQSSVKDAWTDTKWNASYLDYTDKQIADMGRKFLDEQKKFYDSHTDQKDDFIKEIAALDKKWVEDEKTTIDEIEKELPRLKEFYGEDSVIYKSILNIVDGKKLTDNKKTAEKWFKSWTDGYEDLVKEAQDAYKELEKKQENFGKKFLDESDLLTKKTKKTWDMVSSSWKEETVEVFDPKKYDDTYKQIQELKKITDELRAKNLDEDTIAQLWDMDPEKALETAKQMNKYSASALADYSKKKEEVQKEIAAEAQKFYEQEAQDFQTKYMDPLQKYVTEGATKIKENMDLIGKDTVQSYIDGMVDKYDATKGAAEKIGADSIEALKKELGIASPSKEFYEIGEWSIQGFLDGLKSKVGEVATMFVTMGQTAGDHFINAFKSTWDNFVTLLNNTGGLQVPVAMTTTAFGMPVSQGAQVTYTGTGTSIYGLTKDDVVSAIKEAVPDGDVILKVGESEFAKISRSSLNNLALQEGSMGLSV